MSLSKRLAQFCLSSANEFLHLVTKAISRRIYHHKLSGPGIRPIVFAIGQECSADR